MDDFGADPTGVTDAAPLLQTALDTICGAGGGTLVIPPGYFVLQSSGVIMPNSGNITISAYGAHIVRSDLATFTTLVGGGYGVSGYTGPSNVVVRGGTWDGGNLPLPLNMFALCSGENILYENLTVQNIPDWHAIEFQGVRNGTARNCVFRGFTLVDPGRYLSEAIEVQEASDGTHSAGLVVDGCTVDGYGALVGTHGNAFPGTFHDGIRVVNNRITNTRNYGVRAQSWRNVVIANNVFQNCTSAVQVQLDSNAEYESWWWSQTENVAITGNVIDGINARYATIGVYGLSGRNLENVAVSGNIIRDWGSTHGIVLQYANEPAVSGNIIKYSRGGDGNAIYFVNSSGGVATGNNIRYAGAGVVGAEVSSGNRISLP